MQDRSIGGTDGAAPAARELRLAIPRDDRDLFENAPGAYFVADAEGRVRAANRALADLLGRALSEIEGAPFARFVVGADREKLGLLLENSRSDDLTLRCDSAVVHANGTEIPIVALVSAIPGEGPRPSGFRILLVDVSAHRTAERELHRREEMLRSLIDNTTAVIYAKAADGRYIFVNTQFEKLFGVTREELRGKTDHDIFPKENADVFRANDIEVLQSGRPIESEEVAPHSDGAHTYISLKFPLFDAQGVPYACCGISTDITERIRVRSAERRHQAELAHAWRLATVGEMASILAHEINQPLFAIVNYAKGCVRRLRSGSGDTSEILEAMEIVASQAERAGEIVRRLRAFVRKEEPVRRPVDVSDVVKESVALEEFEMTQNGVRLDLDLDGSLPRVLADTIQIEQVLLNLMRNAVEAMLNEPVRDRAMSISTAMGDSSSVIITVRDAGRGISEDIAKRVFESFFTTKPRGMGLGLAISRSIVEAHGGRLWFEPLPKGTAFRFTLPVETEGGPTNG